MTLAIVAILLAAALQLKKFTGDSIDAIMVEKNRFQAEQLALSGINLALLILAEDAANSNIDSVQEAWADPDKLSQAVNELGLEKETLTIVITDELSKIQVNALILQFPGNQFNPDQVRIWENFLRFRLSHDKDMDKTDPSELINSVKDWLDSGDDDAISGLSGAESDYYLDLDFPYVCANGPFNHIDEFLNVKGVSKDLLKNEIIDKTDDQTQTEETELSDVFTVYGLDTDKTKNGGCRYPGRININTACVNVLAALLPEGMENLARDIADFRNLKNEQGDVYLNLLDKGWYKEVIELSEKEGKRFDRAIKYSSNIFKIECTARTNDVSVILVAFLERQKNKESKNWVCRIIQVERK